MLSNGLVDPAWTQWRICHESSTIASFIAGNPEMACRYMLYSLVNKYRLAKELYDSGHSEAPSESELDELKGLADVVKRDLWNVYGHKIGSGDYDWSGLRSFRDIEAEVFHGEAWNPRGHFILASERVHSAPNAGEPLEVADNSLAFVVGPINGGLTGPADLTSLSIAAVTEALMQNASCSTEDEGTLEELFERCRIVGAMCWALDPEILCADCGGYRPGASPPDLIAANERPEPCSCQ